LDDLSQGPGEEGKSSGLQSLKSLPEGVWGGFYKLRAQSSERNTDINSKQCE
jgi:hypothetical protein